MAPKSRIISTEEWSHLTTAHVRNFLSEQLSNWQDYITYDDICRVWTESDSEEYVYLRAKDELAGLLSWCKQTNQADVMLAKRIKNVPKVLGLNSLDTEVTDIFTMESLSEPMMTKEDIEARRYVLGKTLHPFRTLADLTSPVNDETIASVFPTDSTKITGEVPDEKRPSVTLSELGVSVRDTKTGRMVITPKELEQGLVLNERFRDILMHIPTLMDPVDLLINERIAEIVKGHSWWVFNVSRYQDAVLLESVNDYRILWYEEHCDDAGKRDIDCEEYLAERVSDNPDLEDLNELMYGPEL